MAMFMDYSYPGNIRELENLIERSYFLSDQPILGIEDLPMELREQIKNHQNSPDITTAQAAFKKASKAAQLSSEKQMILQALKACNYNCSQAAKTLKISRSSLYNKMKKCDIHFERH